MKIYRVIIPLLALVYITGCDDYERKGEVTTDITVNYKSLDMFVGESKQLTASPSETSFTWTSEDPEVATVSANGLVEMVGEGVTNIVVRSDYASLEIPVTSVTRIPVGNISLSEGNLELTPGSKYMIARILDPENANDVPLTYWESNDPEVAEVDYRGQITAVAPGDAEITCRVGDFSVTASVYVATHLPFRGPHILSAASPKELFCRDFDLGGEDYAFFDTGTGTTSAYRTDNGDFNSNKVCVEGGGGIGYTTDGEWLIYTVEVQDAGDYQLEMNLASPDGGGKFHFEVDGVDVTGQQTAKQTGGWANFAYQDVVDAGDQSIKRITLSEGKHVIKFYIETAGYNIMSMRFTHLP